MQTPHSAKLTCCFGLNLWHTTEPLHCPASIGFSGEGSVNGTSEGPVSVPETVVFFEFQSLQAHSKAH